MIGWQVLGKKSFNKSEVKQNDALVIFASSLYFFEWKKVIESLLALFKSFISKRSKSVFFSLVIFNILKIWARLIGPLFEKKGYK